MESSKMTSDFAGGFETAKARKVYHAPELMMLGAIPNVVLSAPGPGTDQITPTVQGSSAS
jgi:hypothetical protein